MVSTSRKNGKASATNQKNRTLEMASIAVKSFGKGCVKLLTAKKVGNAG